MDEERAIKLLEDADALLTGHFLLSSGRHSNRYIQCARLFMNPAYAGELCSALADKFADDVVVDLVVGPALGAIQMAYEVSRCLEVENCFAERDLDGKMVLRRGFEIHPGQRILVVEDVVTTGGSVREVLDLIRGSGGIPAGVGAIVDRSGGKASFGVPFRAALSLDVESWDARECPLCREGFAPPVKPGSRKIM